jgi:hypothetical protein
VITSDWSSAAHLGDHVTVVDGVWSLSGAGARVVEPHYDRVLAVGDMGMESFAVSADVTIEAVHTDAVRMGFPSNGWAVGFGLKWQGHQDWDDIKPRRGFYPFGALAWYKPAPGGGHHLCLQSGSPKNPLQELCDIPCELEPGTTYRFSCRAELCAGRTNVYRFSVRKAAAGAEGSAEAAASGRKAQTAAANSAKAAHGHSGPGGDPPPGAGTEAAGLPGPGGDSPPETADDGEKTQPGIPDTGTGPALLAEISAPGTEGELKRGSLLFIAHNVTAVLGDFELRRL